MTIIRRAVGRISGFFTSTDPVVRHNHVLAKWEQYYEARPNSFAHRRQHGTLSYFTKAD